MFTVWAHRRRHNPVFPSGPIMLAVLLRLALAAAIVFITPLLHAQPSRTLPTAAADMEYVIKDRDTMIGIARRYLIEGERLEVQRALWEHNRLKDKDRISPGQVIRIPENWMRNDAGRIELARVEGDVQSKGESIKTGARVSPGDELKTGKDGYVTIRLADGSTLALQPGSTMAIESLRKSPLAPSADALFSLKNGRIEASVEKRSASGARFEVRTPIAVAAVRGTRFRVSADEEKRTATSEVIEGSVQVNDTGNLGSVEVPEGFGTRVLEGQAPAAPRALLPAPRLWTGIRLWVRRPIRLNFTRLAGAAQYRVLVARRADFRSVISEVVLAENEIVLPDELENGPYFLKVRGVDDLGLEGKDTLADLVLSLGPIAPVSAPAPAAAPGPAPAPVPAK